MNPTDEDADDGAIAIVVPKARRQLRKKGAPKPRRQPRYNVILWDSDVHTFDYVERMLRELFGHEPEKCKELAKEVDGQGKAVVLTTTKEHAELKRDQIHAYGPDSFKGCTGAMHSTIEAVE